MSKGKDADRGAALVTAVEALTRGEQTTLGDLAGRVFGWSPERVFLAVDAALARKLIAPTRACRAGAWGSATRCLTHGGLPMVDGRCAEADAWARANLPRPADERPDACPTCDSGEDARGAVVHPLP
jgi:hypothetical protein